MKVGADPGVVALGRGAESLEDVKLFAIHVGFQLLGLDRGEPGTSLLTLAAVQGTQLTVVATGDDAAEAVAALSNLVASGFDATKLDLGSATQ